MKAPRPRWRVLAAITVMAPVAACSVVAHAAYSYPPPRPTHSRVAPRTARPDPPHSRPPTTATASYWGVYEPGTPRSYRPIQRFTALMHGVAPRIVLYFSGWGQPFEAAFAQDAHEHGALTLVQIEPAGVSMAAIAAGHLDAYLRSYAKQVRAFGYPIVIGFGHEMNGPWYPWGYGHISPRTWIAAWRHVVTVFRQQGADNVIWMWTANIIGPDIPSPRRWWPGAAYVTWVGIDGYYYLPIDGFQGVLAPTIANVRTFTGKPILIGETGITPPYAPEAIPGLIAGIRQSHLLGLVWFDADVGRDWRLEGHPAAVAAFRSGIAQKLGQAGEPPGPG